MTIIFFLFFAYMFFIDTKKKRLICIYRERRKESQIENETDRTARRQKERGRESNTEIYIWRGYISQKNI